MVLQIFTFSHPVWFQTKLSKSDYSLFTKSSSSSFVALLVYVDDIVSTGPSLDAINSSNSFQHSHFKLNDLGSLKYFLGLELARLSRGIVLSQRQYTLQLLEDTGFLASKPASIPIDPKLQLTTTAGDLLTDASQYRCLIGRLLYLTLSCPNITFAVHKLSQFLSQPRVPHLQAAHQFFHYLKSTPGQGLFFSSTSSMQLRAFSNAD